MRFAVPQSSIFAGFLNMSSYNHCQMPWSRSYESFPPLFLKSYLLQVFKRVYLTSKICLFLPVSCPICGHCDKARASAPFFEGWACEPGLGSLFPCIVHSDCLEDGQWPNQCLLPKPQQRVPSLLLRWLGATSNTTRTESLSENKANTEESEPKRGIKWAFWGWEASGLLCYIS